MAIICTNGEADYHHNIIILIMSYSFSRDYYKMSVLPNFSLEKVFKRSDMHVLAIVCLSDYVLCHSCVNPVFQNPSVKFPEGIGVPNSLRD